MTTGVSVIIPTLDEALYVEDTLRSVVDQQTSFLFEIIVCDAGSKDTTVDIASNYARVIVAPKRGTGSQLDLAANSSKGEILVFLDADTVLPEGYLQRMHDEFRADERLWACGAPFSYRGRKRIEVRLGRISTTLSEYILVNLAMYLWYVSRDIFRFTEIPGCNFCIRRQIFHRLGGFKKLPPLPVDIALSTAVRELISIERKGRMRILKSMTVATSPRHTSLQRSSRLVREYSDLLRKAKTD